MCRHWSTLDDETASPGIVDMLLQANQITHQSVQFRETKLTTSIPFQTSCRSHIIFEPGNPVHLSPVQLSPVLISVPEIREAKFAGENQIKIKGVKFGNGQKLMLNGFDFPFFEFLDEENLTIDVEQDSANVFSIQIEGKYGKSNEVKVIRPPTTTISTTTTTSTTSTTTTKTTTNPTTTTTTKMLRKALLRPQLRAVSQVSNNPHFREIIFLIFDLREQMIFS